MSGLELWRTQPATELLRLLNHTIGGFLIGGVLGVASFAAISFTLQQVVTGRWMVYVLVVVVGLLAALLGWMRSNSVLSFSASIFVITFAGTALWFGLMGEMPPLPPAPGLTPSTTHYLLTFGAMVSMGTGFKDAFSGWKAHRKWIEPYDDIAIDAMIFALTLTPSGFALGAVVKFLRKRVKQERKARELTLIKSENS